MCGFQQYHRESIHIAFVTGVLGAMWIAQLFGHRIDTTTVAESIGSALADYEQRQLEADFNKQIDAELKAGRITRAIDSSGRVVYSNAE